MAVTVGANNLITDVPGIAVGQAEDQALRSGSTVIVPEGRAVAGVDVRGGGPGTRETDLMDSSCMVDAVDAISLSGGSAYGLDAATGAVAELAAAGRGFDIGPDSRLIPLVPAAIIFDLSNGGDKDWGVDDFPYLRLGREATRNALAQLDQSRAERQFNLGCHGAGLGAVAGAYKGGVGSASAVLSDGPTVGALMVANPIGSPVIPGSGTLWAGLLEQNDEMGGQARDLTAAVPGAGLPDDSKMGPGIDDLLGSLQAPDGNGPGANTSIGVVATDVALTPSQAKRIAIMAQDGLARAVRPIHTPMDGDTIFVLSTGRYALTPGMEAAQLARLGSVAADCVTRAMGRAVFEATPLGDKPSYRDSFKL